MKTRLRTWGLIVPAIALLLFSALSLLLWKQGEHDIALHTGQHVDRDLTRFEKSFQQRLDDHQAILQATAGFVTTRSLPSPTQWEAFQGHLAKVKVADSLLQIAVFEIPPHAGDTPPDNSRPALAQGETLRRVLSYKLPRLQNTTPEDGLDSRPLIQMPDQIVISPALAAEFGHALPLEGTILAPAARLFPKVDLPENIYVLYQPIYELMPDSAVPDLSQGRGIAVALIDLADIAASAVAPAPAHVAVAVADLGIQAAEDATAMESCLAAEPHRYSQEATHAHGDETGQHRLTVPHTGVPWTGGPASLVWSQGAGDAPNAMGFLGNAESVTLSSRCRSLLVSFHVTESAYHQLQSRASNTNRSLGGILISFLVSGLIWLLMRRGERAAAASESLSTALTASEKRYQRLFRQRKAVELIIEPKSGRIVDANDAAVAFYGWSHDTLCEMTIADINILPTDKVQHEMAMAAIERRNHFFFRHRLANGQTRDVEVYSGLIDGVGLHSVSFDPDNFDEQAMAADEAPPGTYLYSTIHDVTDRKRAEKALGESEAQFRVLFESSPLAIQVIDHHGHTMRVNRAWEELWGRSSAAAIHSELTLCDDPAVAGAKLCDAIDRARNGEVVEVEPFEFHPPDGTPHRWLRAYAYPVEQAALPSEAEGIPSIEADCAKQAQIILIYHDETDFLQQQEQLHRTLETLSRSNEELEQFAYVASHDLQEPLRMVTSYLTLLRKRMGDQLQGENREFLDFAVEGARRMQDLIRDLLDYARTGRYSEDAELVNSATILDQAQAELAERITETSTQITASGLPQVAIDAGELNRLFTNLIGNAIKYRRPDATPAISVTCREEDCYYRFEIRDNGIGISPEYYERIFKIFQRLHSAGQASGTGIGLAICRKIVEHNGGQIGVTSDLGSGSCFWFTLPIPNKP